MKPRILVVDDSPTMRQLLGLALRKLGAEIVQASDGMDAMRKLLGDRFDLALVDINMPVMDGLKLIQLVRAEDALRSLPIVVITTEGSDSPREQAMTLGANAYLTKPVEPGSVFELVRELLPTA
ncbi:MAG TPA: response regulator [Myxococcota bacterium]|nr:response regulator [Myxococcota bacterium]